MKDKIKEDFKWKIRGFDLSDYLFSPKANYEEDLLKLMIEAYSVGFILGGKDRNKNLIKLLENLLDEKNPMDLKLKLNDLIDELKETIRK